MHYILYYFKHICWNYSIDSYIIFHTVLNMVIFTNYEDFCSLQEMNEICKKEGNEPKQKNNRDDKVLVGLLG